MIAMAVGSFRENKSFPAPLRPEFITPDPADGFC
jgi:hypothetical protein